jgi:uncharacterized damage-inducible protein DinB
MPAQELQAITRGLQDVLLGHPWYGEPVIGLLQAVTREKAFVRHSPEAHSCADVLWHMITWSEFVLDRIQGKATYDENLLESLNWRKLDPEINSWEKGVAEFTRLQHSILAALSEKDDSFLDQQVDFRKYNFRVMLNGLSQHHIYHVGQIAWISKFI